MTADDDIVYDVALRLLDETREELARVEGKASFLLGAASIALGIVAAALTSADGWDPSTLTDGYRTIFWAGVTLVGGGVLLLGLVVYPAVRLTRLWFWVRRMKTPPHVADSADYFADLGRLDSVRQRRPHGVAIALGRAGVDMPSEVGDLDEVVELVVNDRGRRTVSAGRPARRGAGHPSGRSSTSPGEG